MPTSLIGTICRKTARTGFATLALLLVGIQAEARQCLQLFGPRQSYTEPAFKAVSPRNLEATLASPQASPPRRYVFSYNMKVRLREGNVTHEQVAELFENRKSAPVQELRNNPDGKKIWFISNTRSGERYKVSLILTAPSPVVIYVGRATPAMEREFFAARGRGHEAQEVELSRLIKGYRKLTIPPGVAAKLKEKHDLEITDVVSSIPHFNGRYFDAEYFNGLASQRFHILSRFGDQTMKIIFGIERQQASQKEKHLKLISAYLID